MATGDDDDEFSLLDSDDSDSRPSQMGDREARLAATVS